MFERFPWFDQRANFGYGNALRKVTFARVKLLPELLDTIVPQGQPIPKGLYPLHDLQGVFTGDYATHGTEVLSLTLRPENLSLNLPLRGPRLEGLKLIGDANVPGGQLSFIVDPMGVKASNSDAAPHWDDPLLENPPRPILMFRNDLGSIPIDLSTRPVAYRFVAYGQVNHIQGIWNPEWVPATVVVYGDDWPVDSPEPRGKKPEFSVIFSDEDQAFRHIIDYDRVRVDVYRPPSQVDKLRNLYPA